MSEMISFNRPDGRSVAGYLALPQQHDVASAPAIVLIQEWWGLNAQIRGVADRLARAGYAALVPDLYRGKATVDAEEASHLMQDLNFLEAAQQDVRGAVLHLKAHHRKVGLTGFCMGGALAWLALMHVPEVEAAVVWYGYPPLQLIDARAIKAPVLAHWGELDTVFGFDGVRELEGKLKNAGASYTGHHYLAYHAFANESAQGPTRYPFTQYDPAWAQVAWDRSLRFFGRHLG